MVKDDTILFMSKHKSDRKITALYVLLGVLVMTIFMVAFFELGRINTNLQNWKATLENR